METSLLDRAELPSASIRALLRGASYPAIQALKPLKTFAWRTSAGPLRGLILEATTFLDFSMIFINIQNNAMLLHQKAYGGNFLFGKAVAVTDHATTLAQIQKPLFKCNHFMGVDIVASDSAVFATNSGSLNQCPSLRESTRAAMDEHIFPRGIMTKSFEAIAAECGDILDAWAHHPKMADAMVLRGAATAAFLKVLDGKAVSLDDAVAATRSYVLAFAAISAFSHYFPVVNGVLDSHRKIRRDAYFRLRDKYGVRIEVIDVVLFAGQFSVGTLLVQCVEFIQKYGIDYRALDRRRRRSFIVESLRLWPTVTTVHRIVEHDEVLRVAGRDLRLTAGDEVIYPFVCSNRDPKVFPNPERLDVDRPEEQYEAVLSWSKGPHACPAKELSIHVTMAMLDKLAERYDLRRLKIFAPAF